MPLLNDILSWATSELKEWQRDALRRLFEQQELSSQDIDDLFAMLKSAHGIADAQNRQPVPLAQEHLPAQVDSNSPVVLRSMRDLKDVNRLAPDQRLEFSPKGLTIIYGANSSGKSGYSRVLKQACRARDLSETVHPDAFDSKSAASVPEAIFEVDSNGAVLALTWKRGAPPPDELSSIAVFDSRCARAYLDDEQDAAYLPYGLDIVENLAQRVLPKLTERLKAEIASVNTDTTPFADLLGATEVGSLIASLSDKTDCEKVAALATLAPSETSRLSDLERALSHSDPKATARALRLSSQRIDALGLRIDQAAKWVTDEAVQKLQGLDVEAEAASQAEAFAAAGFRADESLLPGTGEQAWQILFEAARRFSTEVAYTQAPFPPTGSDAKCLLCQQPLTHEAAERIRRFEVFVTRDTAKTATEKRDRRNAAVQKITAALLEFGLDPAIAGELEQLNTTMLNCAEEQEQAIEARRAWMLTAIKTHVWENPPALGGDVRPSLKALSSNLISQATELEKAANEEERKKLESERAELRARNALSQRLKPLLALVERMQLKTKLKACVDDLKTKPISDKAKELASKAVTEALRNALNAEFQALGVGHIRTKLNERVEHGKVKHKLVLDLAANRRLDEILSEGEQRAIAIGSFLAELRLTGHQGGIVFDDPVCSLDHHRRRHVARRVTTEAKERQVIVLTHDTIFLGELRDEIERQGVEHRILCLEWTEGRPGGVNEGLPWEHQSYKDRIDRLEKAQKAMEKQWSVYPSEADRAKMRRVYDGLRATIERVIQDVVFNGVIKRYRDWVRVDQLEDVVGFSGHECKEIARLHKACCDVVTAHDPSSAKDAPVPDPKHLGADIADLKTVIEAIKARRKAGAGAAGGPVLTSGGTLPSGVPMPPGAATPSIAPKPGATKASSAS